MVTVYCDATYNQPKGIAIEMPLHHVVAYVATQDNWRRFRKEWRQTLAKKNLHYFHMTDYNFALERLKNGQEIPQNHLFTGWQIDEFEPFFKSLARVINRKTAGNCRLSSFGSALAEPFFNTLRPEVLKDDVRCKSPYIFNVFILMHGVAQWADENNYHDPIYYVFANGDREGNKLENLFRYMCKKESLRQNFRLRHRFSRCYGFKWMKEEPAIQAVDIAAYESSKNLVDWFELGNPAFVSSEKSRENLKTLVKNVNLRGWIYREQELQIEFADMVKEVWKI